MKKFFSRKKNSKNDPLDDHASVKATPLLATPHSLDARVDPELTAFRTRVAAFYRKHNPANLSHVDEIVEMYRGREQVLFETLEKKYRIWNKNEIGKNSSHGDDKTKQRMLAAVLAKQKKNNENFMANIKREENLIMRQARKAKAQAEADRQLALKLQNSETASPQVHHPLIQPGTEVEVMHEGGWCRGMVLHRSAPALYLVQWCSAAGVVAEGNKPLAMIRSTRPPPAVTRARLTPQQQAFLDSMPADIRKEMMANPRMLDMMSSSSPAPSKDTDGAHRPGYISNNLSSPVSEETDVLARQFEFETTAAAAEGADLFGGMTLMADKSSPTSTLPVETPDAPAVQMNPQITTSTDSSLPPPAYTESDNHGLPPAYDAVGNKGSASLTDSADALRKRLGAANDMFREGLISSAEFDKVKSEMLALLSAT